MFLRFIRVALLTTVVATVCPGQGEAKPLKVYILCGQSNMEGHAQTRTFPAIAKDPGTADLYKEMVDADGKPIVCDNVWIAYSFGNFSGDPVGTKSGNLTSGWGSQHHVGTGKIGPEFTFGIYMNKLLNEPILLIKTAWGGKSLMVDFRPPSAGDLSDTAGEKAKGNAGKYYKLMTDYVRSVLADPGSICPAYDPNEGYELAGFVWFQGFNDLVGGYPRVEPDKGKKSPKDYSEYSRLLACFIRDVRKDLSAPDLPFVIGVLGVGGKEAGENTIAFRNAMAAPAGMKEFEGSVVNVFTDAYWPTELDEIQAKISPIKNERNKSAKDLDAKELSASERKKAIEELDADMREKIADALTEDELFLLENGISNAGFHYHGSAKFFAQTGKAFAEAMVQMPGPER